MIDGQEIDFTKHEDLEIDIEQQMVISSKEIVKSVLDIIVNELLVKTLVNKFKCNECKETFMHSDPWQY